MFISKKDLVEKKIVRKSQYSIVYDLGNGILAKEWINLDDNRMDLKRQKVLLAGEYQMIPNLSVPIDTLETEDGFVGYLIKQVPGIDFVSYFNDSPSRLDLGVITD